MGAVVRYVPARPGEALGHYVVRVTLPDGSRPLFRFEPSKQMTLTGKAAPRLRRGSARR